MMGLVVEQVGENVTQGISVTHALRSCEAYVFSDFFFMQVIHISRYSAVFFLSQIREMAGRQT